MTTPNKAWSGWARVWRNFMVLRGGGYGSLRPPLTQDVGLTFSNPTKTKPPAILRAVFRAVGTLNARGGRSAARVSFKQGTARGSLHPPRFSSGIIQNDDSGFFISPLSFCVWRQARSRCRQNLEKLWSKSNTLLS